MSKRKQRSLGAQCAEQTPTPRVKADPKPRAPTRAETLIQLLRRPEGATIDSMVAATGWLPHSIRGFLAGALKKRHGLSTTSERTDYKRVYRIVEQAR